MPTVRLDELRTAVRQRADMVNSKFVTDAELTGYINLSAPRLFDLLVAANVDYHTVPSLFTVASGSSYALPATVYKVRGVDRDLNGSFVPLKSYNFLERGRYNADIVSRISTGLRYRIIGSTLEFLPADHAPGNYRLWAVPFFVKMVADSDTFETFNGYEELIIIDAAIKCKEKEESSTSGLERAKKGLVMELKEMANVRDYGDSECIADVRSGEQDFL